MSRIVGLITDNGDPGRERRVGQMLIHLPGRDVVEKSLGAATFAWKGRWGANVLSAEPLVVAIDGIFFNRGELCARLGCRYESEARLLLDGVRAWGLAAFLQRANGDFAVAVWDDRTRRLSLARDRFGVRPLYFARTKSAIGFASMPWALLCIDGVSPELDLRYLAAVAAGHYRTIDEVPNSSPYRDIRQVPAATVLQIGPNGEASAGYWALDESGDSRESQAELVEQYRSALADAVRLRLSAVSMPAFTLSGGMDSSSVLACAVATTGQPQVAYSTTYEDPTFDEKADLKPMFARHVADWREIQIGNTIDLVPIVGSMVQVHHEPVATATWLSHFELCRRASSEGTTALFGGLGGDELNAGEYDYFFYHFADLRRQASLGVLEAEIAAWIHYHDHPIYRKSSEIAHRMMSQLTDPDHAGVNRIDRAAQTRYYVALHPSLRDVLTQAPAPDNRFSSHLKNRAYRDMTAETLPCCLRAEDRHAAAFGLTHVDPFLDHRLVELMFRVPGRLKIKDGVTKILLRAAMTGLLPEETRTRIKKTGWNAPAHRWFSGATLEWLRDQVSSAEFAERGVYDPAVVMNLIDEHEAIVESGQNQENHMMFLWQVLNTDTWLRSKPSG